MTISPKENSAVGIRTRHFVGLAASACDGRFLPAWARCILPSVSGGTQPHDHGYNVLKSKASALFPDTSNRSERHNDTARPIGVASSMTSLTSAGTQAALEPIAKKRFPGNSRPRVLLRTLLRSLATIRPRGLL